MQQSKNEISKVLTYIFALAIHLIHLSSAHTPLLLYLYCFLDKWKSVIGRISSDVKHLLIFLFYV